MPILLGLLAMSNFEELQCRSEELAQLARDAFDVRVRNMLMALSREFRIEAEQIMAIDGS